MRSSGLATKNFEMPSRIWPPVTRISSATATVHAMISHPHNSTSTHYAKDSAPTAGLRGELAGGEIVCSL